MLSEKMNRGNVILMVGILGLISVVIGTLYYPSMLQKSLYLLGASLLLTSAWLDKNTFFTILEIVVVVGAVVAFFALGRVIEVGIPTVLTLLGLLYLWHIGEVKNILSILGAIGLLLLGAGFAISEPIVYFLGGVVLSAYSFVLFFMEKDKLALVFAVLNAFFALGALANIIGS